ncbi:Clp protease N-terminal domain-containing protein [Streptomyces sp. NPDC048606]|uniref:Clp protease N-terminal domain-containing protein n=1 Tax=Streptomyces sp. NPDC048606 TaxID=3154726 RepID=UPI00343DDA07
MFERFTKDARETVVGAVAEARRAGAATVTEEHLMLSLLDLGALDPLGVDRATVAGALAAARRRGGLSRADEQALAGLGIDLARIVERVEETHGAGALDSPAPRRRTLGSSLRSALGRPESEHRHVPFAEGAKKTLESSLRIALGRGDRSIGTPHLVLALLARPGSVREVLADQGITYDTAETTLAA